MTTSKPKAVLFTKKGCLPCIKTKDYHNQIVAESPELAGTIVFMAKENHSALVESYQLDKYPTLLLLEDGICRGRVVGGKLVRWVLPGVMTLLGALE